MTKAFPAAFLATVLATAASLSLALASSPLTVLAA